MTDQQHDHTPRVQEQEETASGLPLLYSLLTYALVTGALWAETGEAPTGLSWPLLCALVILLISMYVEWIRSD